MSAINDDLEPSPTSLKKNPKRGIIYLNTIPPYMNVSKIKEYFSRFGTVGRIFLQLAEKDPKYTSKGESTKMRKKVAKKFTEGWIEFERKSVAKKVAAILNNTQVSNRKKSKQYDYIWSLKYLSNFKWTHLHERLAYEKAARRQKLRAEIQLAKKKSTFFTSNLDKRKGIVNKEFDKMKNQDVRITIDEKQNDRKEFLKTLLA